MSTDFLFYALLKSDNPDPVEKTVSKLDELQGYAVMSDAYSDKGFYPVKFELSEGRFGKLGGFKDIDLLDEKHYLSLGMKIFNAMEGRDYYCFCDDGENFAAHFTYFDSKGNVISGSGSHDIEDFLSDMNKVIECCGIDIVSMALSGWLPDELQSQRDLYEEEAESGEEDAIEEAKAQLDGFEKLAVLLGFNT